MHIHLHLRARRPRDLLMHSLQSTRSGRIGHKAKDSSCPTGKSGHFGRECKSLQIKIKYPEIAQFSVLNDS